MKYFKYLKYVLRHKWFVMIACFKVGLYWQGLTHDNSKFLPDEFFPYANFFYGKKDSSITTKRNSKGYWKPTDTGDKAMDFAWLLHQKRNPHHWQWWILPEDEGGIKQLPMPKKYLTEMICDWEGAGKAQRNSTPVWEWYKNYCSKMSLHIDTRIELEQAIAILEREGKE